MPGSSTTRLDFIRTVHSALRSHLSEKEHYDEFKFLRAVAWSAPTNSNELRDLKSQVKRFRRRVDGGRGLAEVPMTDKELPPLDFEKQLMEVHNDGSDLFKIFAKMCAAPPLTDRRRQLLGHLMAALQLQQS